jgi:hypothetical protein
MVEGHVKKATRSKSRADRGIKLRKKNEKKKKKSLPRFSDMERKAKDVLHSNRFNFTNKLTTKMRTKDGAVPVSVELRHSSTRQRLKLQSLSVKPDQRWRIHQQGALSIDKITIDQDGEVSGELSYSNGALTVDADACGFSSGITPQNPKLKVSYEATPFTCSAEVEKTVLDEASSSSSTPMKSPLKSRAPLVVAASSLEGLQGKITAEYATSSVHATANLHIAPSTGRTAKFSALWLPFTLLSCLSKHVQLGGSAEYSMMESAFKSGILGAAWSSPALTITACS